MYIVGKSNFMNSMYENDFLPEASFPFELGGCHLEKRHFDFISDLAEDQGRDPHEYLQSILMWMREKGFELGEWNKI